MKLLPVGALSIAYFLVVARAQAPLERWACLSIDKCQRSGDPRPEAQEFARAARIGRFWPEEHGNVIATFMADRIRSDERVFRLNGNAEIITSTVTVKADEADYHWDTGEIEARGTVRVKPIRYNPSIGLREFGVR